MLASPSSANTGSGDAKNARSASRYVTQPPGAHQSIANEVTHGVQVKKYSARERWPFTASRLGNRLSSSVSATGRTSDNGHARTRDKASSSKHTTTAGAASPAARSDSTMIRPRVS